MNTAIIKTENARLHPNGLRQLAHSRDSVHLNQWLQDNFDKNIAAITKTECVQWLKEFEAIEYVEIDATTKDVLRVASGREYLEFMGQTAMPLEPVKPETTVRVEPKPEPAPTAPYSAPANSNPDVSGQIGQAVATAIAGVLANQSHGLSEAQVIDLIKAHSPKTEIELTKPGQAPTSIDGLRHYKHGILLAALAAGVNVALVGPAGTSKSTGAELAAKDLELVFRGNGAVTSEYKLLGFRDANGNVADTVYRESFRDGGLHCFDEAERSAPAALICMNSGLANDWQDFPDGVIKKHENFLAVATMNTWGRGNDGQYNTAQVLDGSTKDRLFFIEWDYDSGLEAEICGVERPIDAPKPIDVKPLDEAQAKIAGQKWFDFCQAVRKAYISQNVTETVSVRAMQNGMKLLAAGLPWDMVAEGCVWRGLAKEHRQKVEKSMSASQRFHSAA